MLDLLYNKYVTYLLRLFKKIFNIVLDRKIAEDITFTRVFQ